MVSTALERPTPPLREPPRKPLMNPSPPGPPQPNEPEPSRREDLDRVFSAAYEELRRLARNVRRDESSRTLNPTALVHEAWLKLSRSPDLATTSPLHFRRIAARAMRQVLVEAARRRRTAKRGGGHAMLVTFDDSLVSSEAWADDLVALDMALDRLTALDARQARVVECRFFAGLGMTETAEALGISLATAERDWRAARAWLAAAVSREQGADEP